ncbi:hypothetical protein [Glycomyces salinus]|uniref:hypothetical protein n=1 Tax=Glycomyces salinus TaxID=980294 RepID=UPI0018EBC5A3|nr:hypothetical protein [Glycomyces salinus]
MPERKLDPEAMREFQRTVREKLLDKLEDDLMPMFKGDRVLSREPRWGDLPSNSNAKTEYSTFHSTTWQSLEGIRSSLYGLLERLDESIEAHESSETTNASGLDGYGDQL